MLKFVLLAFYNYIKSVPTSEKTHSMEYTPLYSLMPNFITMASLFFGCQQFICAINHNWSALISYCVMSALLDVMDGRIARMMDAASRFGAELDSLADIVVFGVAPAFAMYNFSLHKFSSKISWSIAVLYIMCIAIRLARFNTQDIQNNSNIFSNHGLSVGLPAPMCAASVYLPILLFKITGAQFFTNFLFCSCIIVVTSCMAISTIATPTLKKFYIKSELKIFYMLLVILIFLATYMFFWYSLMSIMCAYYISILVCHFKFRKIKKLNKQPDTSAEKPKMISHDKSNPGQ